MPLEVPTTRLPQRGVNSITAIGVFALVLGAIMAVGLLGRGQPPAPIPRVNAVAERTDAPAPTAAPSALPTATPVPTPVPPCAVAPVSAMAGPLPRHPRALEATGVETVATANAWTDLATDRDGSLWAFGRGRLVHLGTSGGVSRSWTFSDDALFDAVGIAAAAGGGVWLFGSSELSWFDGDRFLDTLVLPEGMADISDAAEAPDGSLWVSTLSSFVWHWDGMAWRHVEDCGGTFTIATNLAVDAAGDVWVALDSANESLDERFVLARFDGSTWRHYGRPESASMSGRVFALEPAADGSLWVGTNDGLTRFDRSGTTRSYGNAFAATVAIAPEPDGAAWIAAGHPNWGPMQVRIFHVGGRGSSGDDETELPAPSPAWFGAMRESAGSLFLATSAGLVRFAEGRWVPAVPTAGPPWVGAVVAVSADSAWVAGDGVWLLSGGRLRLQAPAQALFGVADLARDRSGAVWVAFGGGVGVYVHGVWHLAPAEVPLFSVAAGSGGSAWVGMSAGFVERVRLEGDTLTAERVAGSTLGDVQTIAVAADGTVWAGCACTDGGADSLARFDGQAWEVVHPVNGPGAVGVSDIAIAPGGDVWVALVQQPAGTSVIARLHGSRWTTYTDADGAPDGVGSLAVAADGTVWAAGSGLARFDGRRWTVLQRNHWFGPISTAPDGTVFVVGPSGLHRLARGN